MIQKAKSMAIVPFVSTFDYAYLNTTKIDHKWTVGRRILQRASEDVPDYDREQDLCLHVVIQFFDAAESDQCSFTNFASALISGALF